MNDDMSFCTSCGQPLDVGTASGGGPFTGGSAGPESGFAGETAGPAGGDPGFAGRTAGADRGYAGGTAGSDPGFAGRSDGSDPRFAGGAGGFGPGAGMGSVGGEPGYYAPYSTPYDHTAEFDPRDISDNKVFCMVVYLMGTFGVIIAMLASNMSPFVRFHVREALKITVIQTLTLIFMGILCWTVFVPIVGAIFLAVLFIVRIICFVRICSGRAVEPPIVRSFGFLK